MKVKKTYDYIHDTNIYLHQRSDMFRINTDTSLLANFMRVNEGETVMDIGTNNGALLLMAATYHPAHLYGVEIQHDAAVLAKENLETQEVPFTILEGDARILDLPGVNVVVCNPPYFKISEDSNLNESEALKIARHECYLPFEDLCKKVSGCLQEKGRFYIVHRADRITELICMLQQHRLTVKKLQFVYDENKDDAISVLIEAMKDAKPHVHVLQPIVLKR